VLGCFFYPDALSQRGAACKQNGCKGQNNETAHHFVGSIFNAV
jgi:hypothetical protein